MVIKISEINFLRYLLRANENKANPVMSIFLVATFIVPWISSSYCSTDPNVSYCYMYLDHIDPTSHPTRTFFSLVLYGIIVLISSMIFYTFFQIRGYYKLKKEIDENKPIDIDAYEALSAYEFVARCFWYLIGIIIYVLLMSVILF